MKKLSVKDIITIVVISVLMLIIQHGAAAVLSFNMFAVMVLCPMVVCFLNAVFFMVMAVRVGKRGALPIYAVFNGLSFLLGGYWMVTLYLVVTGFICELIVMRGDGAYKQPKNITVLWSVFSIFFVGASIIPINFLWSTYEKASVAGGFSAEYLTAVKMYFSDPKWILFIAALAVIGAILGSLTGHGMMKKHFIKAGAV